MRSVIMGFVKNVSDYFPRAHLTTSKHRAFVSRNFDVVPKGARVGQLD